MNTWMRVSRTCWIGLIALLLLGCETTRNVDPSAGETPPPGKAWVVFTVSHDQGPALPLFGASAGGGVTFKVFYQDAMGEEASASSMGKRNAFGNAVSDIDGMWGSVYVREVPAGKVAFTGWDLVQNTGPAGFRVVKPNLPPPPRSADVSAGSITYLGNAHAATEWGTNLLGLPLLAAGVPTWKDESSRDLEVVYKTYPKLRGRVTVAPLAGQPWITLP